ncbi:MAG: L,D-transpeptidase [Patescibacteria group bacterium]
MSKTFKTIFGFSVGLFAAVFLFSRPALAEPTRAPLLRIVNPGTMQTEREFYAFDENFKGGGTVAVGDLGGDGMKEIVVGAGPGGGPQVRIVRLDGTEIKNFFVYGEDFRGGIRVAVGDLNGDGRDEIITGTGEGGGPQIRVFDGYGREKFTAGFFAFAEDYRGGVQVAACDVDGNGLKEILVGSGRNSQAHVRVFNRFGVSTGVEFRPFGDKEINGVSLGCANIDGGEKEEVVVGANGRESSIVKVYSSENATTAQSEFLAFPSSFQGGVNVAGGDIDGDTYDEIVVSANSGGGPHVRGFEADGRELPLNYFAYEKDFRGGVNIALGNVLGSPKAEVITLPDRLLSEGRTDLPKYIEIDLAKQIFRLYIDGYRVAEFPVSSGKSGMDTPKGEFKVLSKARVAYSSKYGLWMPNFMLFTRQGHGIHGLPFWKLRGGGVIYEGESHLGRKVSHGCVRLPVPGSYEVFDKIDVGTPIFIH